MILILDNFDSFTYNLVDYFERLQVASCVMRNNVPIDRIHNRNFNGIVISPGPGIPSEAGITMNVIKCYAGRLPILGVCLGHQAIGEFYGATIAKAKKPMHGKISLIECCKDELFNGIPNKIEVVRYHSLIITKIPESIGVIAKSESGEVMAVKHRNLDIYGLQFHPEAVSTQFGLKLLENWALISGCID